MARFPSRARPRAPVNVICTDSRALNAGDLFRRACAARTLMDTISSRKPRGAGRSGLMVEELPAAIARPASPLSSVTDTLRALQQLAGTYRRRLSIQVIGITGSNGKTSAPKTSTACVLGEHFQVTKTAGNLTITSACRSPSCRRAAPIKSAYFRTRHESPGRNRAAGGTCRAGRGDHYQCWHRAYRVSWARAKPSRRKRACSPKRLPAQRYAHSGCAPMTFRNHRRADQGGHLFCGIDAGDVLRHRFAPRFLRHEVRICAFRGAAVPSRYPRARRFTWCATRFSPSPPERSLVFRSKRAPTDSRSCNSPKAGSNMKIVRGLQILDDTYNANPDSMKRRAPTLAQLPAAAGGSLCSDGWANSAPNPNPGIGSGPKPLRLKLDYVIGVGEEAAWIAEEAWRGGIEKALTIPRRWEDLTGSHPRDGYMRAIGVACVKGSRSARRWSASWRGISRVSHDVLSASR